MRSVRVPLRLRIYPQTTVLQLYISKSGSNGSVFFPSSGLLLRFNAPATYPVSVLRAVDIGSSLRTVIAP